MIRVTCRSCGSKLNAKDELAGQERKCPKCGNAVLIVPDQATPEAAEVATDQPSPAEPAHPETETPLPSHHLPTRLNRGNHYLICDKSYVAATWENNGNGWMLKRGNGFVPAKRNRENLAAEGDFKLVELKFAVTPDGRRLSGLAIYQLASRWAMTVLDHGDDQIVAKITGSAGLNREQKFAIRQALKDQFMRQVWQDCAAVLEYLGNADYHTSNVE